MKQYTILLYTTIGSTAKPYAGIYTIQRKATWWGRNGEASSVTELCSKPQKDRSALQEICIDSKLF